MTNSWERFQKDNIRITKFGISRIRKNLRNSEKVFSLTKHSKIKKEAYIQIQYYRSRLKQFEELLKDLHSQLC